VHEDFVRASDNDLSWSASTPVTQRAK